MLVYGLGGQHNDALMLFCALAAVALVVRGRAIGGPGWDVAAGAAIVAGVAFKLSLLGLVPLVILGARRRGAAAAGAVAMGAAVADVVHGVFGGRLPATGLQDSLVTPLSAPNVGGLLLGAGGATAGVRTVAHAILVVVVLGACAAVAHRRERLIGAAGVVLLATVLALAWTVPWYVVVGPAVRGADARPVAADRRRRRVGRPRAGRRAPVDPAHPLARLLPDPHARRAGRPRPVRTAPALTGQAVRYLLVGVSNTAITLVGYAVLVAGGVPAVAASALAFAAGALNGYRLNRNWTFRSARRGAGPGARYLLVVTLGLGLNAAAVALAVRGVGLPKIAGEVAALPPVTALTFVLARSWVFGGAAGEPTADTRSPGPAVPRPH